MVKSKLLIYEILALAIIGIIFISGCNNNTSTEISRESKIHSSAIKIVKKN